MVYAIEPSLTSSDIWLAKRSWLSSIVSVITRYHSVSANVSPAIVAAPTAPYVARQSCTNTYRMTTMNRLRFASSPA